MVCSPNRKRNHQVILRFSDTEYKKFKSRLDKTGMTQSGYVFNLVMQRPILNVSQLNGIEEQIRKIGVNINQVAKKVNISDNVLENDLKQILKEQVKIWQLLRQLKVEPLSNA